MDHINRKYTINYPEYALQTTTTTTATANNNNNNNVTKNRVLAFRIHLSSKKIQVPDSLTKCPCLQITTWQFDYDHTSITL